jgi:hypothetical protein
MATLWTISGQAGKVVGPNIYTLEQLQAQGLDVDFQTLASDTASWSVWLRTPEEAGALVPELGQTITIFRNAVRYFTGTVTRRRLRMDGAGMRAEVVVEGPWWYLKQIFLSSEMPDQSGTSKERSAFVLDAGSPRQHIIALLSRAVALGAPISGGGVASCFPIPRLSLRNIPFSEAFAEVMRWVADGHMYFDYHTAPLDFPKLCMQRRTPATRYTLTPAAGIVTSIDVQPRLDLQVDQVHVMYAKRSTVNDERVTTWEAYSAGVAQTGLPRRQPVLTSGPELDTFLPPSFTDSVKVKSSEINFSSTRLYEALDDRIRASGVNLIATGSYTKPTRYPSVIFTAPSLGIVIKVPGGGQIPSRFAYYLTEGDTKDWFAADGIETLKVKVTATVFYGFATWLLTGEEPSLSTAEKSLGGQNYNYLTLADGLLHNNRIMSYESSIDVTLVTKEWKVPTTIIRKEDYFFINPPATLAADLLASQNWLPYEGQVSYVSEDILAGSAVGGVLNIAGLMPETTNMRAMISGHRVRVATGEITYTLGSPARLAYRDLVNRFRQNGADNVVFLRDSTRGNAGSNPPPDPILQIPIFPSGVILDEAGDSYEGNEDGTTYPTTEDT